MNKKYNIVSTFSLLPLVVRFKEEGGDTESTVNVKVDYRNDKVYFEDPSPGLDLESLEGKILESFKPPEVEIPDFYYEHLSQIQEVSKADFASSFLDSYKIKPEGGPYDSRQP